MNNTGKILLGAGVGAFVGYILGTILADQIAPEYYTDEELDELEQNKRETIAYAELTEKYKEGSKPEKKLKPGLHINKDDGEKTNMGQKKNYAGMFEPKEPLEKLVRKYNQGEVDDEEDYLEDEEDYELVDNDEPSWEVEESDSNDFDEYEAMRDETKPYFLSEDEYDDNATGFKQVILKYYEGDDVVTDENNLPLNGNVERVVGDEALISFGLFSSDFDVVHVCNPKLKGEYKIVRHSGAYSDATFGPVKPAKDKSPSIEIHNVFKDAANGLLNDDEGDDEN